MKMKETKDYKIDSRNVENIHDKIEALAKSYTPQWKFDVANPDMGSVIALVFANQMMDNVKRYNTLLERFHAEFANMLGISLLPAQPAQTMVSLGLIQDIIPGIYVPKGTKLLSIKDEESIVFETAYPVYVTNSRLQNLYMVSANSGKIVPILGSIDVPELFQESHGEDTNIEEEQNTFSPFGLYRFKEKGIQKNAIIFSHRTIFDIEDENIYMMVQGAGANEFFEGVLKGEFTCVYNTDEGCVPVEHVEIEQEKHRITLRKEKQNKKIEGSSYSSIAFIANQPIKENIVFSKVLFSSSGRERIPSFVGNGTTELLPQDFNPFGDTLSLFSECFIGFDEYFSKSGAKIRLQFHLDIRNHSVQLSKVQENEELKIIKRKPRTIGSDTISDAYAEEISIEYYNGNGWKRLGCNRSYSSLFQNFSGGEVIMEFVSPGDWESNQVSGYEGRCLRIQLLKSDNCYMMPCNHHYPHIKDMIVSYSYEEEYEKPEKVECIYYTRKEDLTGKVVEGKEIPAFIKSAYQKNTLYMGFRNKFEMGPVSLYFQLSDNIQFMGAHIAFYYSTLKGYKPLKIIDNTRQFTQSGTIRFMPPEDMVMVEMEGNRCFWIQMVDMDNVFSENSGYRPWIQQIKLNVVEAANIETLPEQSFYMDMVTANMKFQLNAGNILDADVWVNEKGRMTQTQMKQMLRDMPEDTKAEYDFTGRIQEFYVRWTEVDNFENTVATDRYYMLDRMSNQILFGDGVHVMIPRELDGTAFRIVIRSCDGADGNVPTDSIQDTVSNINYIDTIRNISVAYGGTNLETVESALRRSANMISSRKRLVTQNDYVREILAMSDNIDKVACVIGQSIDGSTDSDYISIVLLMKDFGKNAYSFYKLLPMLQKHLQENCEITVAPDKLQIVEPITAELSMEVWTSESKDGTDFEIQEKLKKGLDEYLNPVSGNRGTGWQIGEIPTRSQIMMKLNSLKTGIMIRKIAMIVKYADAEGIHECDIQRLPENPFYICNSGTHKIHIFMDRN